MNILYFTLKDRKFFFCLYSTRVMRSKTSPSTGNCKLTLIGQCFNKRFTIRNLTLLIIILTIFFAHFALILDQASLILHRQWLKHLCACQIVPPPSTPGHPRGHHFFVLPRSSYHFIFSLPRPIKSLISPFFRVPWPSHTFFLWSPGGGWGKNNLTGALQ